MLSKIRVLVLDADPFVRNSVRWLLTSAPDFDLVGETANIPELPNWCAKTEAHLLLIGGGNTSLFREIFLLAYAARPTLRLLALLPCATGPTAT